MCECGFENSNGFLGVGAFGWLVGLEIPQLPWCAVHDRFAEQRDNIEILAVVGVDCVPLPRSRHSSVTYRRWESEKGNDGNAPITPFSTADSPSRRPIASLVAS